MAPFAKFTHFILSFRPVSFEGAEVELRITFSWGCLTECFGEALVFISLFLIFLFIFILFWVFFYGCCWEIIIGVIGVIEV